MDRVRDTELRRGRLMLDEVTGSADVAHKSFAVDDEPGRANG
jgi:hypothetical protein